MGRAWRPISMASSKPGGGDQRGAGAFAFEQRVGADGGAVEEDDIRRSGAILLEGFDDGLRGIGGGREDFQHAEAAAVSIQTQSVKVPPVSMAMRRGWGRRGMETKSNTGGSSRAVHPHVSQRA